MFKKVLNVIFVISWISASFWKVLIKFRWHGQNLKKEQERLEREKKKKEELDEKERLKKEKEEERLKKKKEKDDLKDQEKQMKEEQARKKKEEAEEKERQEKAKAAKGQLISECLLCVIYFPKTNEKFDKFLP